MKILELWKDIKDFEGIYKISNIGRIISVERYDTLGRRVKAKMLKVRDDGRGYNQVDLSKEAIRYTYKVHRLVALAFLEKAHTTETINHMDGNKTNNRIDNLEWMTRAENTKHAWSYGLHE